MFPRSASRSPRSGTAVSVIQALEGRRMLCAAHNFDDVRVVELRPDLVGAQPTRANDPADIVWLNRATTTTGGAADTDGFGARFGTSATRARAVVDAVIVAYERMIGSFNYATAGQTYGLSLGMNPAGSGFGAAASLTSTLGGKPKTGDVAMGAGTDTADPNDDNGWFLDPTPFESSEFQGNIVNAFAGDAQSGSPAAGRGDFYTVVASEMTHCMGLFGSGQPGWAARTTNTNVADLAEAGGGNTTGAKGTYYVFRGPSIKHLMTSNNGGSAGSAFDSAFHSAGPVASNQPLTFGGDTYQGAEDQGNAIYEFGRRYLVNNTFSLMFKDAYGYSSVDPAQFSTGTMYYTFNQTTGQLLVRGGGGVSNDSIEVSNNADGGLHVSVDVGSDVPGTGALPGAGDLPAFVVNFPAGQVTSVLVQAGEGDDAINLDQLLTHVTVVGGGGNDQLFINDNGVTTARRYDAAAGFIGALGVGPNVTFSGAELVVLNTGTNNDRVDVEATGTGLIVDSAGGSDTVNIGGDAVGGDARNILADVLVRTAATVNVNDITDPTARTVAIDFFDSDAHYNRISGMTGGNIYVRPATVNLLNITTGAASDSVTVRGLNVFTNIGNGGSQRDHYAVGFSATPTNLQNVVQFLAGPGGGDHDIDVNNSSDFFAHSYSLGYGQLNTSFSSPIHWDVASTSSISVEAGFLDDSFDVVASSNSVRLSGGLGNDTFTFDAGTAIVNDIFDVTIIGGDSGGDALFIDDRNQPALPAGQSFIYAHSAGFLRKRRDSGTSLIDALRASYDGTLENIYWRTGLGNDRVSVSGTISGTRADFNNAGGNDADTVGGGAGGLDELNGTEAYFHNGGGTTTLTVDDAADPTGDAATLYSDGNVRLLGMAQSQVVWNPNEISSITVKAGLGDDQLTVNSLPYVANRNRTTFDMGAGNDVFTVNNFTNLGAGIVLGNVSVIGGLGSDRLFVDDSTDSTAGAGGSAYGVGDYINHALIDANNNYTLFRAISHDQFETLQLTGGTTPDTIFANCIQPNVQLMQIDGGGGDDHIEAEANAPGGVTLIRQSAGIDNVLVESNARPGVAVFDTNVTLSSLTITNGGTARIADLTTQVTPFVAALNITGTGRLDVTDNALAVDYVNASPAATIRSLLTSGYAGGAWNGNGISSSTAAVTPRRTVGYAEASAVFPSFPATFYGRGVDATTILIAYTLAGDTDLNRTVNFGDLLTLSQNYGQTGRAFSQGDANYDGVVGFDDLLALSQNYGASAIADATTFSAVPIRRDHGRSVSDILD